MKDINRIKVVLVEKKRDKQIVVRAIKEDPATISKWSTNTSHNQI